MQVRADLRCADRLVGPDEAYVFPKEPFILQTPVGQMSLKEISALPGARESVRTYAEIAEAVGSPNAYRAVGMAANRNPLPVFVPCHRVLGKGKKLVWYALGLETKKYLLDLEKRVSS